MTRNRSRSRRPRRPDEAASDAKAAQGEHSTNPDASSTPAPKVQVIAADSTALTEHPETPRKPRPEGSAKTDAPAQEGNTPSRRSSRRRGNRRRNGEGPAAQSQAETPAVAVSAPQEQRPARTPNRPRGEQPTGDRGQSIPPPAHADAQQPARGRSTTPPNESGQGSIAGSERRPAANAQPPSGSANANKRRRGQRRKTTVAPEIMPTVVLKPGIAVPSPSQPMTMRKLEDLGPADSIMLGCPMLTRTKVALPSSGGMHAPRCNLAWAIRNEEEVSFCLRTPTIAQCWKVHPERMAELLGTTEPAADPEATAAD